MTYQCLFKPDNPIIGHSYIEPDFFDTQIVKIYDGHSWQPCDVLGSGLLGFIRTGFLLALCPIQLNSGYWSIGTDTISTSDDLMLDHSELQVCSIESFEIYKSKQEASDAIHSHSFTQLRIPLEFI